MKRYSCQKGIFFLVVFFTASFLFAFFLLAQSGRFYFELPLGLDPDYMQIPEDNPITPEKAELGKLLYFDPRLSKDGTISCATCHDPQKGFTDQMPVSIGINGQKGKVNAPTVLNAAYMFFQFWDGRAKTLEEQAKGPIENPIEMGNSHEGAVENVANIEGYKKYFRATFGSEEVTIDRIAKAIATFERTVLSGNSAWDRYTQLRDENAMSESAKRGLALFEGKARCTQCHVGFTLSDSLFHNIGVGMSSKDSDLGRFKVTGEEKDKGAFKTPTLRDLLRTAPYMHDGSVKTLEEVIDLYIKGGEPNPWLDPKMQRIDLTAQEKADLLEFMKSLEGDWKPIPKPELPA
jgi:cytochrome c peroxidase